jgi:hypothetical protein
MGQNHIPGMAQSHLVEWHRPLALSRLKNRALAHILLLMDKKDYFRLAALARNHDGEAPSASAYIA